MMRGFSGWWREPRPRPHISDAKADGRDASASLRDGGMVVAEVVSRLLRGQTTERERAKLGPV